jgi:hypothetical protein
MDSARRRLRAGIIAVSRLPLIRTALRKASQLATWEVGRELAQLAGVEAVYTRHSHPRSPTFAPGQSDLDLTLVLSDEAARDPARVGACVDRLEALSRVICFVWPQDARLISRRELAQLEAWPGAAEILSAPSGWIRIGGREVRGAAQAARIESDRVAKHPEFNAWWLNVLQTHVLTPNPSLGEENMRLCYRVAMKSRRHLQAARGPTTASDDSYLLDSEAAALFADDPEMARLLGGLEHNGFWARDGEARKPRILHRCIANAAQFYRDLPMPADTAWTTPAADHSSARSEASALSEAHRAELCDRIGREGALRAIAESIIVYPTPHWTPCEYQIDVILKDEIAPAAFDDAVRAIRRSFGGRTFGLSGTHAQLTLVPRRAFEHPWYFLGTPFPFLHEHVAAFGETLFGSPPRIPTPPARAERLRWCANYFLFHRFTLHYRPRYISKDCNFCQLAALRLFLQNGEVFTDATWVRRAYLDTVGQKGEAVDFLLSDDDPNRAKMPFAAALQLQSREYAAIEDLLRGEGLLPHKALDSKLAFRQT